MVTDMDAGRARLDTGIGARAISAKRMDAKMPMRTEEGFIFILLDGLLTNSQNDLFGTSVRGDIYKALIDQCLGICQLKGFEFMLHLNAE
jgi:hypothetical protein